MTLNPRTVSSHMFQIGVAKVPTSSAINTANGRVPQPASSVALRPHRSRSLLPIVASRGATVVYFTTGGNKAVY